MDSKKRIKDVLFKIYIVIGMYFLYFIANIDYVDTLGGVIFSKLTLFGVITAWTAVSYPFVMNKYKRVMYSWKHNMLAIVVVAFVISSLFWFLNCCGHVLGGYRTTIVDMIVDAPVIFVKAYFMSKGFIRLLFWFAYCCVLCVLMYLDKKQHWFQKITRKMGFVFDEDIVEIKDNVLILPFKCAKKKAILYFAVNGKGMLLPEVAYQSLKEYSDERMKEEPTNEDVIKFGELLDSAFELNSEDGKKFYFDDKEKEKFEWDNYEIREEGFWYELIPLNLTNKEELSNETSGKRIFSWDKFFTMSFWFPLVLFVSLTYSLFDLCFDSYGFGPDEYISVLKYIAFMSLMVFTAKFCNLFIVNKDSTNRKRILTFVLSMISTLVVVLFLNNLWHYIPFGVQFNWPKDVNYMMFLVDDITYHVGLGWLRYPGILMMYTMIYYTIHNSLIPKGIRSLKRILVEVLSEDE